MRFTSAGLVEQVLWQCRMADLPRGTNRALIDRLANGLPPWTKTEQQQRNIKTNVNYLEFPKLLADARRTYYQAFLKPGTFFTVTIPQGDAQKKREWGNKITAEINRRMKASRQWFELVRSQGALVTTHGIAPSFWQDRETWCPVAVGIEDVMVPSNTLLTLDNLSYFGVFRQYTAEQLRQMTSGPNVDPAWNMPVVEGALKWADSQTMAQLSYSELYAPQKVEDRWKQDLGFYGTDAVPTIDCWDFYFHDDDNDKSGWRRRMVLDTPGSYEISGRVKIPKKMPDKNGVGLNHGEWLYCPSGDRIYSDTIDQIVHFEFADASACAPFRYHTVRSLGWLLYAVCHLQNRLRCKFNDAVFESLLQYIRTSNPDDKERILKLDLHDLGVVPDGVEFVKPQDRWQINQALVQTAIGMNQQMMAESAAQFREGRDTSSMQQDKTATQVMAEVNSANALVGTMMMQSYQYKTFMYREIGRRFCVKNSKDKDVREFRNNILKQGVPEEVLDVNLWNIEPDKVLGSGNKMLEIAQADKLMAARPLLDPESQRDVTHLYVAANGDPDLANRLVPLENPRVSDTVHDVQMSIGTIMEGLPVAPKKNHNPIEAIGVLLGALKTKLDEVEQMGGMTDIKSIKGFMTMVQTANVYIQQLSQDKEQKELLKQFTDVLGELTNRIKMYGQRLAEAQQQAQQHGGQGMDPKDVAKVQGMQLQAQTKAEIAKQSAAQRTAQRQVQFEQKIRQDAVRHQADLAKQLHKTRVDDMATDLVTASEIRRGKMKSLQE